MPGDLTADGASPAMIPATSGRRRPAAWTLYDFANTIFSFAVVSGRDGPVADVDDRSSASATGKAVLAIAVVVSVGLNALVSPILGALSDRAGGGCRSCSPSPSCASCRRPSSGRRPGRSGVVLFIVANFAYQAALIYYDATLKLGQQPATRGKLSRDRDGDRVLRHGLRRAADRRPRRSRSRTGSCSPAILFALFAIPIFLFVREPGSRASRR